MARVTVEDCNKKVPDRFELAALASQHAKDINARSEINHNSKEKHDKPTVTALRRIASGIVSIDHLQQELLKSLRSSNRIEHIRDNVEEIEEVAESFDYMPGSTDVYVGEDYSDLDSQGFTEEDSSEKEL